jgi:hypothetical protein
LQSILLAKLRTRCTPKLPNFASASDRAATGGRVELSSVIFDPGHHSRADTLQLDGDF